MLNPGGRGCVTAWAHLRAAGPCFDAPVGLLGHQPGAQLVPLHLLRIAVRIDNLQHGRDKVGVTNTDGMMAVTRFPFPSCISADGLKSFSKVYLPPCQVHRTVQTTCTTLGGGLVE
jgi:hypothetical protein